MNKLFQHIKSKTRFIYTKFAYDNKIYLVQFRGLNWFSFEKTVFFLGLSNLGLYIAFGLSINAIMAITLSSMSKIMEDKARQGGRFYSLDKHLFQYQIGDILHIDQLGHFLISSKCEYGDGYRIEASYLEKEEAPTYVIISGIMNFAKQCDPDEDGSEI